MRYEFLKNCKNSLNMFSNEFFDEQFVFHPRSELHRAIPAILVFFSVIMTSLHGSNWLSFDKPRKCAAIIPFPMPASLKM